MTQLVNGNLQISSRLVFQKAIFSPDDYHALREFYNQVVAKHAEPIVLKKSDAK